MMGNKKGLLIYFICIFNAMLMKPGALVWWATLLAFLPPHCTARALIVVPNCRSFQWAGFYHKDRSVHDAALYGSLECEAPWQLRWGSQRNILINKSVMPSFVLCKGSFWECRVPSSDMLFNLTQYSTEVLGFLPKGLPKRGISGCTLECGT